MKKLILTFSIFMGIGFAANAQTPTPTPVSVKEAPEHTTASPASPNSNQGSFSIDAEGKLVPTNAPVIEFVEETFDFGELPEGPQATHEFKFKNTGTEPLIISNVKASCGCTTPNWPKEPVAPGAESVITATYNTQGRVGPFTKSITITSNASSPTSRVNIKGTVVKVKNESSPNTKSEIGRAHV